MRKFFCLLSVLVFVFTLSACSSEKLDNCYACQEKKTVKEFEGTGYYLCDECASKSKSRKCTDCGEKGVVAKDAEESGIWLCDNCWQELFK